MQLEMSLHVTLGCEYFSTLHTSVLRLDFGVSLDVLLVKVSILEFSATNITLKNGHLRWPGQLFFLVGLTFRFSAPFTFPFAFLYLPLYFLQ